MSLWLENQIMRTEKDIMAEHLSQALVRLEWAKINALNLEKENMSDQNNASTTIPNDKKGAELWIENLKIQINTEKRRVSIRGCIEPLRMLIQAGRNELPPDTVGGGNLDVAQQVVTEIEKANEG